MRCNRMFANRDVLLNLREGDVCCALLSRWFFGACRPLFVSLALGVLKAKVGDNNSHACIRKEEQDSRCA